MQQVGYHNLHGPLCGCLDCTVLQERQRNFRKQHEQAEKYRTLQESYMTSDAELLREERAAHEATKAKLANLDLVR